MPKNGQLPTSPFETKDSGITVEEMVKQVAGKVGENIQVRRFVRFNLGEGIEVVQGDVTSREVVQKALELGK